MRTPNRAPLPAADAALVLLVFAGTALYLALLPHHLGASDESYFLYEAKRVGDGEVLYRDVFEFTTPLATYAMATAFRLFGTTMTTARVVAALLQAGTAVVLYLTTRVLGVRRALALLVPLAYVGICVVVWPYASWHWFSTFFTALLLLALVAGPWAERPRWTFVSGMIAGLLIGVQQQKGLVIAAGTALYLGLDFLAGRRYPGADRRWRRLFVRLGAFAAGVVIVLVPLLLACAWGAGWRPLYDSLIRFPLENYHARFHSRWGAVAFLQDTRFTFVALLTYSPLALVPSFVRWIAALFAVRDRQRVRALGALVTVSVFAVLSIGYFPDIIHVAFIAGFFCIAAADGVEWILRRLPPRAARPLGVVAVAGLASALLVQLANYTRVLHSEFSVSRQTAFGRIDFGSHWEAVLVDKVRELLAETPSGQIFCYPQLASPYLATGGRNPTPYQFLLSGVSPIPQIRHTIHILETQQVPYVIGATFSFVGRDPVVKYIQEHYEFISIPEIAELGEVPLYGLYGRKDLPMIWHREAADGKPGEERPAGPPDAAQAPPSVH